jgi:HEPN domain-containing protein
MVLSAFASELLLKCLLIIETGEAPDNIHELHTLFGKLKHKTKRRIEEIWDAERRGKIEGLAKLQGVPDRSSECAFSLHQSV